MGFSIGDYVKIKNSAPKRNNKGGTVVGFSERHFSSGPYIRVWLHIEEKAVLFKYEELEHVTLQEVDDMTDYKRGDRVRTTVDGTVRNGDILHDDGTVVAVDWYLRNGGTIEKTAPKLPTTPGSVIRGFSDSECGSKWSPVTFMLRDVDDPGWVCSDHGYVVTSPELLEGVGVIFDAGLRAEGSESFPTSGRDGAK